MATKPARVYSDLPIPPGAVLAEELAARGISRRELSDRTGLPHNVVSGIIKGEQAVTPDTAIALGKALGGAPQFWINLEADYQMTLARQRAKML